MNKTIFLTGILLGTLAIVFGAFGAHSLKDVFDASTLNSFETAVRYQMYHALLLLIIGQNKLARHRSIKGVYYLITFGIICFSFSIYLLTLSTLAEMDLGYLGLITPFGGVLLICGWLLLGYRFFKHFSQS